MAIKGYLSYTNHEGSVLRLNNRARFFTRSFSGAFYIPGEPIMTPVPSKPMASSYGGYNTTDRQVIVVVAVSDLGDGGVTAALRALYAHFWPDQRDSERGTITYTTEGNITRELTVTPPDAREPGLGDFWHAAPGARGTVDVTLRFWAEDPGWSDTTIQTGLGAIVGVGAIPVLCTSNGDMDAWCTINVDPVATQTTNLSITDSHGNTLSFTGVITPPRDLTLVLNPARGVLSMKLDDGTDWKGLRNTGSKLPRVAPGANNITFTGGAAGDDGGITVTWKDKFSGHG